MNTSSPRSAPFIPWRTAIIAMAVIGLGASPELTSSLTVDRENWTRIWPLFTGHLCHWTSSHLFWDLLVFVIAGGLVERRLGRAYIPSLAVVSVVIVGAVFLCLPHIESYRGLSGIDTFLYTFAVVTLIREALPRIPEKLRGFAWLPLFLLFAKIAFEVMTGEALFAGSLGEGVSPVPLAHLVGALLGLAAFWTFALSSNPAPTQPVAAETGECRVSGSDRGF